MTKFQKVELLERVFSDLARSCPKIPSEKRALESSCQGMAHTSGSSVHAGAELLQTCELSQQRRLQIIAGEKGERELCGARERERSVTPVFAIKTAGLREGEGGRRIRERKVAKVE